MEFTPFNKFKHSIVEFSLSEKYRKLNTLIDWVIAASPFIVTILFSLFIHKIEISTRHFVEHLLKFNLTQYPIDWPVVGFWITVFIISMLYYFQIARKEHQRLANFDIYMNRIENMVKEQEAISQDLRHVTTIITSVQNMKLVQMAPQLLQNTIKNLYEIDYAANEEKLKEDLEAKISCTLRNLIELTTYFSKVTNEHINANIMLIVNNNDENEKLIKLKEVVENRLIFSENMSKASMSGILYLVPGLIHRANGNSMNFISLPISQKAFEKSEQQNTRYVLPGAPEAVYSGFTYISDTSKIGADCGDFAKPLREQIVSYFKNGDGKEISSIVSMRIGDAQVPVGIINIDSNKSLLLGATSNQELNKSKAELQNSFNPLYIDYVSPILTELSKPVSKYAELVLTNPNKFLN